MAELFIFSIAESLIAKLASGIYEEASQVLGLYDHLKEFQKTLLLVKAVLLDAEQKQEKNHELREWLSQLKTIFYDAEHVLDEFECQTLRKQVVTAHGTTKDKVLHFLSSSNPLVFRYKMAQQIKDVNIRLDKVATDGHKFSLQTINVDTRVVHRREMTHSHVIDSDVIGREQDKTEIIQLLMQPNPDDDDDTNLSVIPIVGIGGLGKTTLAKFVFNDKRIDEFFPLKMWVCVSDDFDIKQLIIKIIDSVNDSALVPGALDRQQNFKEMNLEQLQIQVRNKLAGQKFLLVLDDVWNEERVRWVELRNILQVGAVGSKILVTTRSHFIASMMGTVTPHVLEGLSPDESQSLFVKWAFKEGEEDKYPHLINIGRIIVNKCKGVPLALRTLGSLLFLKFEAKDWESVRDNEIWRLPQEKDGILPALKLSYDLMPSVLRQCFALCSLYPKDYEFNSFHVTWLWRPLGLLSLPENYSRSPEDVSLQYLYTLHSRSFLQDFVDFGTDCTFKIHDLVHDLAQFVAKDECLLVNSQIQSIPESIRHLSFVENDLVDKSLTTKSVGVRTILFPIDGVGVGANADAFFVMVSRYKYLLILDLSYSSFETLPSSIAKLKHLRHLSLRYNKKIKTLPAFVCKFQSLLSLWLRGCTNLETLPKGLKNLISLQHLEITTKQAILPETKIAYLSSLQYLNVEFCYNMESLFSGIQFPIVKILALHECTSLKSLPLDRKHFPALEILYIEKCNKLELFKGHEDQNLYLKLKTVHFGFLPQLGNLPHWLQGSVNTLLSLGLEYCDNLMVLPDWLPMLTCLRALFIVDCPKLRSLPDGIGGMTALEHLTIEGCPELCRKYEPRVGECWNQISHIKHINIDGHNMWRKR